MRTGNEIALIMNEVIGGASRLAHRLVYIHKTVTTLTVL